MDPREPQPVGFGDHGGAGVPAPPPAVAQRRRRWVVGSGIVGMAVVPAFVIPLIAPERVSDGRQVADAQPVEIGSPSPNGWMPMEPLAPDDRSGFPTPVVRVAERICVGFARIDFGPDDVRPSLARCVQPAQTPIAPDAIRLLVSVKSGLDTWHFLEAGGDIVMLDIATTTRSVDPMRVYVEGAIVGLRLENGVDIEQLTWWTMTGSFECDSGTNAWRTGALCVGV